MKTVTVFHINIKDPKRISFVFMKPIPIFFFSDNEPLKERHFRGSSRGRRQRHRGQSVRRRCQQKPIRRFSVRPRTSSSANFSARRQLQPARIRSSVDRTRDEPSVPQSRKQQAAAASGRAGSAVTAARTLHLLQQVRIDSKLRLQHFQIGDSRCRDQSGKMVD